MIRYLTPDGLSETATASANMERNVDDKNSFCNFHCLRLLSPDGRWIVLVSIAVLMIVGMEEISRFVLASLFYHIKIGFFGLRSALLLYLPSTL
jgi:hypothetical protein